MSSAVARSWPKPIGWARARGSHASDEVLDQFIALSKTPVPCPFGLECVFVITNIDDDRLRKLSAAGA